MAGTQQIVGMISFPWIATMGIFGSTTVSRKVRNREFV